MTIALARTCATCGAELSVDARRDRRFCSSTCRTTAYRRRRRTAAAQLDWRASAWLLERGAPERWAARGRVDSPAEPEVDEVEVLAAKRLQRQR